MCRLHSRHRKSASRSAGTVAGGVGLVRRTHRLDVGQVGAPALHNVR